MRNATWAIFASRKSAKSIIVAYRNGQLQAFDRDSTTNNTIYVYTNASAGDPLGGVDLLSPSPAPAPLTDAPVTTWPDGPVNTSNITWYTETVNSYTGGSSSPPNVTQSYDLSKSIDDVLFLRNTEVTWRVTVSEFEDTPLLSSAAPIRHQGSDMIVAVTGITTALSSISQFLRELTSTHSGYLYLTTSKGQLLAASTNSSMINTSGPIRTLVMANESSDAVIKAGAQWLNERYGFEGLVQTVVHAENVVLEGKRYYIDTFCLSLPRLKMVTHLALSTWQKITSFLATRFEQFQRLM